MPKQTFFNLPDEKRGMIIECAIDEFAEHGFDGASISRMVAKAGIAKGSFYQYFEDKEDMYGYILDYTLVSQKLRISDEESAKLAGITLTEFLRLLLKRMVLEFSGKPKILKIGRDFLQNQYNPIQKRISKKYLHISDDYFQSFIRDEKSRNEIDVNVDDDMLSLMLMGAANQIADLLIKSGDFAVTAEYIDDWVDKVEYILANGIYKNTTHCEKG